MRSGRGRFALPGQTNVETCLALIGELDSYAKTPVRLTATLRSSPAQDAAYTVHRLNSTVDHAYTRPAC